MVGIYLIQNKLNYKVYVGQSWNIHERLTEHKRLLNKNQHPNRHLQFAWNKYGSDAFVFSVLCDLTFISDLDESHGQKILDDAEILWIDYFGGENSDSTYNIKSGGSCGKYSIEYRKRLSEDRKGKFSGKNNSMFGRHHTEESKAKMSENRKGKSAGANHPLYGKHLSDEAKKKISDANRGRVQSEEEKAKRNKTMQALRNTQEFSEKMKVVAKQNGLKRRKYSDEFVLMLRKLHSQGRSIKSLSKEFDVPFESCRLMINKLNRYASI
jgi:group I intron endonuclease